jgi:Protein of unknown function (DUF1568).
LTQRFSNKESLLSVEKASLKDTIQIYRERLTNISWFMRSLNEYIARKANAEDECTGRFWEGRFKSQALLDEAALLSCMAYVDLNPVRAKIAPTPEQSDFTSIQLRVKAAAVGKQPKALANFIGSEQKTKTHGIRMSLTDYLTLVDYTGRIIHNEKRGALDANAQAILARLNISNNNWLKISTEFEHVFTSAVGAPDRLSEYCQNVGLARRHGITNSKRWLSSA